MNIPFSQLEEAVVPHFKGGEGAFRTRAQSDGLCKILRGTLDPGCSIGLHTHEDSSEIIYIRSGTGRALYDGETEALAPGDCHYCPKGHAHSLINSGDQPLVFFAVVPNQ